MKPPTSKNYAASNADLSPGDGEALERYIKRRLTEIDEEIRAGAPPQNFIPLATLKAMADEPEASPPGSQRP